MKRINLIESLKDKHRGRRIYLITTRTTRQGLYVQDARGTVIADSRKESSSWHIADSRKEGR